MTTPPDGPNAPAGGASAFPVWLETRLQDLRYAARGLRRAPGFTITVVLTLGLGIGANTAMFGILDRLMFKPYPYMRDQANVHRVYLQSTFRERRSTGDVGEYTRYLDMKNFTTSFSQSAGFSERALAVGVGLDAKEMQVGMVSAAFWDFFDAKPALGHYFVASQDSVPKGDDVAVLSYEFWQREFGGRNVLGQTLKVHNVTCTIIGVLPKGFVGVWEGSPPQVYFPITTYAFAQNPPNAQESYYQTYNWGWMEMMVRRKPGVSIAAASADLTQAHIRSWNKEVAQNPHDTPASIAKPAGVAGPLKQAAGPDPSVEAKTLRWVGGIALIVLLIACSNVTNLFLSRALKRRRETAVRLAMGVERGRLMAQWFTESLLLGLIGCGAGVIIAQWGGSALRQLFVGTTGAPIPVATDWRTLGITTALALLAALLTGLAPALLAGQGSLAGALKAGAREGTYQRSWLRSGLLITQVTLSVVLLVGAGLFVRSFVNVKNMRLGYDVDPVVLVSRNLRGMQLDDTASIVLSHRILETAQALPGVEHAAWVSSVPFWSTSSTNLEVEGIDSTAKLGRFTYQTATPDYFATMGTRIVRGRAYTDQDREGTPPVVVVSESMAKKLWPGQDAIGKCIRVGSSRKKGERAPCREVIGIAEDAFQSNLTDDARQRYYMPIAQYHPAWGFALLTRVTGNPRDVGETLRKALQHLMPGESYITTQPMRDIVDSRQRAWRFGAVMFAAFGFLALLVAAIGLYGVVGYNVAQRMHDFGVRRALGAQAADLLKLVLSQGVRVAVIGVVIGLGIALALSSQVQPLLFKQDARDPAVMGLVTVVLMGAAIAATVAPARRAAKADPNLTLRSE